MLQEKAGEIAGKIWETLNENGEMSGKDLKKAVKAKSEKELYLGLGWLLREDKIVCTATDQQRGYKPLVRIFISSSLSLSTETSLSKGGIST